MELPKELSKLFERAHFDTYPIIKIPQEFSDERGQIRNIADGNLGDVAIISSRKSSVRASHVHKNDWHLSYLISGLMEYTWSESLESKNFKKIVIEPSQLFYTPALVPHRMKFLKDSEFIAISAFSRSQENYETDTERLPDEFFN